MIILYHNQSKITEIVSDEMIDFSNEINRNAVSVLLDFADQFEEEILVWCHESQRKHLNVGIIDSLFHHKKLLYSFTPSTGNYFDKALGYIEDSPFIKVNKKVRYPTWQASSQVGAIHGSVLKACKPNLKPEKNFDYFLNSLAKRAIAFGLFCYSEPQLLTSPSVEKELPTSGLFELFKFAKEHYRMRWIFILFFDLLLFEKRFPLLPLVASLFYKRRRFNPELLNHIEIASTKPIIEKGTIDVLIPTIGRKDYLLEVLRHLTAQTHLPVNVIVIEQNPIANSKSELDFIQSESWPFVIKHHFTHQTGACNARNLGLEMITSEFCFMADDDIVFENDLLEKALLSFQTLGNEVLLISCHLKSQIIKPEAPKQFPIFGGGHAFVKSDCLKGMRFNMAYEYGFGEDADFGMQLLYKGYDILLITTTEIIHLKAPFGGFRTVPVLQWSKEEILPKPSPTVMYYRLIYHTKEQLQSYKVLFFIKSFTKSFFRNPIKYSSMFQKKWNKSIYWATELKKEKK